MMKNECNVKQITDVVEVGNSDYIDIDFFQADCGWIYYSAEDFKGFTYCPNCGKLLA